MLRNEIICGDSLEVLPTLPRARLVFADPPDNLGVKYDMYDDRKDDYDYWMGSVMTAAVLCDVFWLSFNAIHHGTVWTFADNSNVYRQYRLKCREYIWRFTFGQHHTKACGPGYRPMLCVTKPKVKLYPREILVPSLRQTRYNDKRANPEGRVPDDVWEFSRVCGTFKERRAWHPNQHPEALIERIIRYTTRPGDLVIDMFAGTGTMNRVCHKLDRECIGIDLSRYYCKMIRKEAKQWE